MIGRDAPVRADAAPCCASGGDVLAVTDLVLPCERGGFTVDHVSLTLGAGEIVGIYGLLGAGRRSEEHTSELQSLMRISYAVFCLKKKNKTIHSLSPSHRT